MRSGTLLATIASRTLWIECRACGHGTTKPVQSFIDAGLSSSALADLPARLKCSKCWKKQIGELKVVQTDDPHTGIAR